MSPSQTFTFPLLLSLVILLLATPTFAIKFTLPSYRYPPAKCIWDTVHDNALVIVTANVGPGANQRVDVEIVDNSPQRNVYLSKKGIDGETRLAVTAHAEGDVGVCFRNYLDHDVPEKDRLKHSRVIDLDMDIGADAVDYNAIANQESLSGLEVEMRKLEGVVQEIVDELNYLKVREERFSETNESTLQRVQNFSWFIIFSLLGLGAWQIFHLRAYFKRKYLID
ncbi:hypothetical protein NEOLEDRAFT_1156109 [Neolentinus lepideus HHB14362 ss-1]|uniref:GOLD domain-containing protein n=1 Tax=Neolentinus lepideus HHB14362 ss-1 TaxID=1314782 RepID=A0A165STK6_9AGAM|nr:hypothetical protein NEOLEDRAFT_1156109 [Neolentinus lepideus HHB14362 ss-1]